MSKVKILLQLYSVIDSLREDYEKTLRSVKEMGYDGVEFPGWTADYTAPQMRALLEKIGLVGASAHVDFPTLIGKTDKIVAYYQAVGCEYLIIPTLEGEYSPGGPEFPNLCEKIISLSKKIHAAGMQLAYHNHEREFQIENGGYILDNFYDRLPTKILDSQLDLCWVDVAGVDVPAYLKKMSGRVPTIHFKDYTMNEEFLARRRKLTEAGIVSSEEAAARRRPKESGFEFRPVGHGIMDYKTITRVALEAGCKYIIIEQDQSTDRPPMQAAADSVAYLRNIGI